MNGELAQMIALVAFGNLYLNGGEVDLSANSTFQYVSSVKFACYKNKLDPQGLEVANNVSDWLAFLRSKKVKRLWNIVFAWDRPNFFEHIAASFANGVPRAIQADLPAGFELWYPLWNTGGPEKKPWLIEYRSLMFQKSHAIPLPDLGLVKAHLQHTVSQAEQFARRPEFETDYWAACFAKSLELLNSAAPQAPYHPDLLPDVGYSLEARQVLASAVQAYVFGGMGSWNDFGFKDPEVQKEYERITKELYDDVKFAIVMASNSFSLLK